MNRILKIDKDIAITNSRKIVDARNYIRHGYDNFSVDVLWSMVINHLPKLRNEVISLLNSLTNILTEFKRATFKETQALLFFEYRMQPPRHNLSHKKQHYQSTYQSNSCSTLINQLRLHKIIIITNYGIH